MKRLTEEQRHKKIRSALKKSFRRNEKNTQLAVDAYSFLMKKAPIKERASILLQAVGFAQQEYIRHVSK